MSFIKNTLASSLLSIFVLALSGCGTSETSHESGEKETTPAVTPEEEPYNELERESPATDDPIDTGASALHPDDTWPGLLMGDAGPDLESSWLNKLEISGDYEADLRSVGFDTPAEDFEKVVAAHEEFLCEPSFTDDVTRLGYISDLRSALNSDRVDEFRTIIQYKCPGRAETVDRLFIYLEKNTEG